MLDIDGSVRALVGGRDYGASQFNRATKALRQAGSSFKSYIYAAAMENGYTPDSVVSDGPISWGNWSPKNYSRSYSGKVNSDVCAGPLAQHGRGSSGQRNWHDEDRGACKGDGR